MSTMPPPDAAALALAALHLQAAKMFSVASFAMLVYDIILTFSDEVERIWKQRWTGATLLFALNRYLPVLQFIIVFDAFFANNWSISVYAHRPAACDTVSNSGTIYRCTHFVRFEGSSTTALVGIAEIIMILRVYALYRRSLPILLFLATVFCIQVSIMAVAVHFSQRVPLPPGLTGCILTGTNFWFNLFWTIPLATDTSVFLLTLWASRQYVRSNVKMPILHVFLRDGIMYYLVIFTANLSNTLIYILAPADLKAVGASFSQLVTATMVSRLQLNIRIANNQVGSQPTRPSGSGFSSLFRKHIDTFTSTDRGASETQTWVDQTKTFMDHAVGNLGEELEVAGYLGPQIHVDQSPVPRWGMEDVPMSDFSKRRGADLS